MIQGIRKLFPVFIALLLLSCGTNHDGKSKNFGQSDASASSLQKATQKLTCLGQSTKGCYIYKSTIFKDQRILAGGYFACSSVNKSGLCVYWGQVRLLDEACIKADPLSCKFWNTPFLDIACVERNGLKECTLWGEAAQSVDFEHKPIPNPVDRGACLEYFDRHCLRWELDPPEAPLPSERH